MPSRPELVHQRESPLLRFPRALRRLTALSAPVAERERRRGPRDQEPLRLTLLPHRLEQGRPAGAHQRPPRHPPEHQRPWRRLSRRLDRLRPAPAADQRAPQLSVKLVEF